jgi:integrase
MAHAVRRGELSRNSAALATIPHTEPSEPRKSLTAEQAQTLVKVTRAETFGAAMLVQIMLGLRPGEVLGLQWLDLKGNVLHVRRAVHIEGGRPMLGPVKTEASNRPLRLPQTLVDALTLHKRQQGERKKYSEDWEENDLIFPTSRGTLADRHNYRRTVQRIMTKAGIEGEWTSHELRHSCASLLADAGVPLEQIADQLGHVDSRMVQRTYRHRLEGSAVGAAVAPMDELFA